MPLAERSAIASLSYQASPGWSVTGALGAILDGEAGGVDLEPGFLATVSTSWLAIYEAARRPFLLVSFSLGASRATAIADDGVRTGLVAGDGRVAVLIGKSFGPLVPAIGARAFGGPVSWRTGGRSVMGGDVHHYAVGASLSLRLGPVDLFGEAMPLGERSLSGGLTYSF
jgi:hypothetical protein